MTMVNIYIYIEMLQNATYNFAEFTRSVEPLKCFSIYAYLLEKQTAVQPAINYAAII